jgi:hypothetical protein
VLLGLSTGGALGVVLILVKERKSLMEVRSFLVFFVGTLSILLVSLFLWIRSFHIRIHYSVLSYTTLFGGTRVLNLAEIESARVDVRRGEYGDELELVLNPLPYRSEPPIRIRPGIFSKKDQEALVTILNERIRGEPLVFPFKRR